MASATVATPRNVAPNSTSEASAAVVPPTRAGSAMPTAFGAQRHGRIGVYTNRPTPIPTAIAAAVGTTVPAALVTGTAIPTGRPGRGAGSSVMKPSRWVAGQ